MFAINHAATALIIKKIFRDTPLFWILISVQFMEILWVILNYLGVEKTSTKDEVRYVGDIYLKHMPYSHSVSTMAGMALLAWFLIGVVFQLPAVGLAVGLGILSHLILDLITHDKDIALLPFAGSPKIGLGLYPRMPVQAFFLELGYGFLCWWIYGGGVPLLIAILLFNVANMPLFFASMPVLKQRLAHRPRLITTMILIQIVVTLVVVGLLS